MKEIAGFIKDKRDINAQEGMWRAANYLVVLTFFQILIGVLTIIFVWRTLVTQRAELREAQQANSLQLKAYFTVSDAKLKFLNVYGEETSEMFREIILTEEESDAIDELIASGNVNAINDDQEFADALIKQSEGKGVDENAGVILMVEFALTNIGQTPAWDITPFIAVDLKVDVMGVDLLPRTQIATTSINTGILSPDDTTAVHILCSTYEIQGTRLNPNPLHMWDKLNISFVAEASLEDIETRSHADGSLRRFITVVGSTDNTAGGDFAFRPFEIDAEKATKDMEDGYFPIFNVRIAGDDTVGFKREREDKNESQVLPPPVANGRKPT